MTTEQIVKAINDWIDFQNVDQPDAPRTGQERIEWFAKHWIEKNPSKSELLKPIEKEEEK
jgi:hypothetical protein